MAERIRDALALMALALTAAATARADDDAPGRVLWTSDLASDSKGSGAVADIDGDGRPEVVFGTYFGDAHLYAVNGEDGSVLWRVKSRGGPFDASVAVCDLDGDGGPEVLAADSATGDLFCVNGASGRVAWTMKLPSGTDSPPAVADVDGDGRLEIAVGTMWGRDGAGWVCLIDPRKRAFVWQRKVKGCVQSAPALADLDGDGVLDVVVASWRGDRSVTALDGRTGEPLWTVTTEGDEKSMGMYHGVCIVGRGRGRRVLFATCQGEVYGLDAATGAVVWKRRFEDYLFAAPTAADLDGDGAPELIVGGRRLRALRAADGAVVWERDLGGFIDRGAAASDVDGDGRLELVLSAGNRAFVLEGATGATEHAFDVAVQPDDPMEKVSSAPLVADLDGDGALDLFVVTGRGYSGEHQAKNRGRAMAIRLGAGPGPAWTTFRGNRLRTGRATD